MYCWSQVVTEKRSGIDDCTSGEMGRHLFQLFTLTSVVWFVLKKIHIPRIIVEDILSVSGT